MFGRLVTGLAVGLVLASFSRQAASAEGQVRLRYDVPASCPSSATFMTAVTRLTTRVSFTTSGATERSVAIRVEREGATFMGELRIDAKTARSVDGHTCEEVIAALALVTALAIDSPATTLPEPLPQPPPSPPPPPALPPPPASPSVPLVIPVMPLVTPIPVPDPAPEPPRPPTPWNLDLDAAGTLRTGIVQGEPLLGARVAATFRSAADRALSPAFGVAVTYATSGPFDGAAAEATFKLVAAQLDACPLRLVHGSRFSLYPCVAADLGVFVGTGEGAQVTRTAQAAPFWADVAVGPRAVVRLGGPFFARLDADAAFSVAQPSFVFVQPTRQVDAVAGVGFVGALGLGATIW